MSRIKYFFFIRFEDGRQLTLNFLFVKVLLRSKFDVKFVTKRFLFSLSEVAVPVSVIKMNFSAL